MVDTHLCQHHIRQGQADNLVQKCRHYYYLLQHMPGSYRPLTHLIHPLPFLQTAKLPIQHQIQAESSQMEELREGSEGKWDDAQNMRFCIFVHYFQDIFASKHKRKICKIFKTFAEYLGRRSATQCRSHFQKMMEKHRSITKMKRYYKNLNGQTAYRKHYENFKFEWEQTHQPLSQIHPEIQDFREIGVQTEPLQQPSVPPCLCQHDEQHILSNQMAQMGFWNCGGQLQQGTTGNYLFWLPAHSALLCSLPSNIPS